MTVALELPPTQRIPALLNIVNKEGKSVPFNPNRVQDDFLSHRAQHNVVLKYRQVGISYILLADNTIETVNTPNTTYSICTHLDDATEMFRLRVRNILQQLSDQKQCPIIGLNNDKMITFPELNSRITFHTAKGKVSGRADTINIFHCSELAFWEIPEVFKAFMQAVPPTGRVDIESTPNGAIGEFHDQYVKAKRPGSFAKAHFYPWWWQDEYRLPADGLRVRDLTLEEKTLVDLHDLSLEQIMWRRFKIDQIGELFPQEYPEDDISCFITGTKSPFSASEIQALQANCKPPISVELGGMLKIWQKPRSDGVYVVSGDVAGGGEDGDYAALCVLDARRNVHVASFHGKVPPNTLAQIAVDLSKRYNGAYLGIENNSMGLSAVYKAAYDLEYANMHWMVDPDRPDRNPATPGWRTDARTRPIMVADFIEEVKTGAFITFDEDLVREISQLGWSEGRVGRSRKLEASKEGTDDLAIAAMIAMQLRQYAPLTSNRGAPARL